MLVALLKNNCHNKVREIENKLNNHNHKYITTVELNTLTADVFNARLSQANLITKTDFDAKLSSLNKKITQNKTKHLLVKNELNKLKTFDLGYFIGKSHFEENGTQYFLVFQPMYKYFKVLSITQYVECVSEQKSEGLSNDSIRVISTSDNSRNPTSSYYDTKIRVKFTGGCLKQPKISYTHGKFVNIYIVYELGASSSNDNDPTLKNCLFGPVTLTKNSDIDKFRYCGYGIGFDRTGSFSFPGGGFGQNVLTFGVEKKDILVLGTDSIQGLEHTLTAEKMYSINLTVTKKKVYSTMEQIVIFF